MTKISQCWLDHHVDWSYPPIEAVESVKCPEDVNWQEVCAWTALNQHIMLLLKSAVNQIAWNSRQHDTVYCWCILAYMSVRWGCGLRAQRSSPHSHICWALLIVPVHCCSRVHAYIVFNVTAGEKISLNLLQLEVCLHNLNISEHLLGKMEDMPGILQLG